MEKDLNAGRTFVLETHGRFGDIEGCYPIQWYALVLVCICLFHCF